MTSPESTRKRDDQNLIPGVVKQLLSSGEDVEARYELRASEAYATPKRLIVVRNGETTNIGYDRIATIRDTSKPNVWLILFGVALFAFGGTSLMFPAAGAALILLGVLLRPRKMEIFVTGLKEPVVLDGAREVLGPLSRKIAEKRGRPSL